MEMMIEVQDLTKYYGPNLAVDRLSFQVQEQLTPGDFAAATRHATLIGQPLDSASLIQLLHDECMAKQRHVGRPIGFVS